MRRVLAIDPSSGSKSSMPGFAVVDEETGLLESGTYKLDIHDTIAYKLSELLICLEMTWGKHYPNIVVTELIPPRIMNKAAVALHKSIGVVQLFGGHRDTDCQLVSPVSWKAWLRREGLLDLYVKSDQMDAFCIGACYLKLNNTLAKEGMERILKCQEQSKSQTKKSRTKQSPSSRRRRSS